MSPASVAGMGSAEGFGGDVIELAAAHGITVGPAIVEQLRAYAELLLTWNERINLTAASDVSVIVSQHFPDSFCLAAMLPEPAGVVDVGSGGGLPAIPLALLRPELRVSLVEPIAKKVAFLRTAVRELGLSKRVGVEARRAEMLAGEAPGVFDVAMARAVLAPDAWVRLALPLVRPGGRIFVLAAAADVPAHPEVLHTRSRSYAGGRRHLIELERRFT